jgi:DNA repair protein RadC
VSEGHQVLNKSELIASLLCIGVKGENAVQVERCFLSTFGGIPGLHSTTFLSMSFDSNVLLRDRQKILHINNDDIAVTKAFVEAGKLLDVEVLDHLSSG